MLNNFKQVEVNGQTYPIKFAQSVIGKVLKKFNIKLADFNSEAMQDIEVLYELIYLSIRYSCKRTDTPFEFDREAFTYELDDDPDSIEKCIEAYAESLGIEDEEISESEGEPEAAEGEKK